MSINKFENKILEQINSTNRSMNILQEFIGLGFLKVLTSSKVKKATKGLRRDPEFQAAVDGLKYQTKEVLKKIQDYEEKYGRKPKFAKLLKYL